MNFLGGKADLLILRGKWIHLLLVPYLWRADPSFRNSITGSGSRAKCSISYRIIWWVMPPKEPRQVQLLSKSQSLALLRCTVCLCKFIVKDSTMFKYFIHICFSIMGFFCRRHRFKFRQCKPPLRNQRYRRA